MDLDFHVEMKLLVDCSEHIPALAQLYFNQLSKRWVPNASVDAAIKGFQTHLNKDNLPLTCVALHSNQPIAMASLRITDGIRPDLTPWLGSLVVDPSYRKKGIGEKMIAQVKAHAKALGFNKLYLFAFEPAVANWYNKLGWKIIAKDTYYHHPVIVMDVSL